MDEPLAIKALALDYAIRASWDGATASDIVQAAKTFHDFLTGGEDPEMTGDVALVDDESGEP